MDREKPVNKKPQHLFRISYIVQGAESLDTALRSANGLAVYPPLVEPYQEVPALVEKEPAKKIKVKKRVSLKDLIHTRLLQGSAHSTELSTIAKKHNYSRGNVAKSAKSVGGVFDAKSKTWSLK
jgi:hypothetical protein